MKLQRIEQKNLRDHYYLNGHDDCYYLLEYMPGEDFDYSEANQLIPNFKKKRGASGWKYKGQAISKVAEYLEDAIDDLDLAGCTLVPIPPSKIKTNPQYDDRMTQVLNRLNSEGNLDVREIINAIEDRDASHLSGDHRPKLDDLVENYELDLEECEELKSTVVLFDDLITAGAHFKACKQVIQDAFPDIKVIGVFIARRVVPDPFSDFLDGV
ncbi:hypothetical protein [Chitinophaga silvisoli]|uniref:Phosphoribosyltransferase n=1 Tax=Chitinophaga silvisoli TaxID=2291814 RepID=A0A3E1P2S0_9BACT|nr:hypothetical protein [Chitinophaga silvisoli]RFM34465.1 hypothetical protein DXN04_14405 [Chitinophaga silvisoli]